MMVKQTDREPPDPRCENELVAGGGTLAGGARERHRRVK
jgi:hypothetical protein